jgi:hypothetical protein
MRNVFFIFAVPPEADMTPMQIASIPPRRREIIQQKMVEISNAITPLADDTAEYAGKVAEALAGQFPGVKFCVGQTIDTKIVHA